jgi:hypothetical protein
MGLAAVQISSKSFRFSSSPSLTTKNAWAQLVRRRFYGQNLIKACMREWDLTERQARGLVYAQCSQNTIDAILKRDPIEGFALSLEIAAIVTGIKLEEYLEHRAREAAHAQSEWQAAERRLETLRARVSGADGSGRCVAGAVRPIRSETAGLGRENQSDTLTHHRNSKPRKHRG